jgi:serine/threonine protein kinase
MYDAKEIGLEWQGSLDKLQSVQRVKCAFATVDGRLKEYTGATRCFLTIEDLVADGTLGKLAWAKRGMNPMTFTDCLIKRPNSQNQAKQEAVIQWLVNKSLNAHGFGIHCPQVFDVFYTGGNLWFSMEPIYNAPILDIYIQSLPTWGKPHPDNGIALLKIVSQIALCCHILEKDIGFNHRDLKPDNILIKTDRVQAHTLKWKDQFEITIDSSPTAIMVDFGFSCLGPGTQPWIQAGDGILPYFDSCPKIGRDVFMLLVFLLWRIDVRASLTDQHLEFFKASLDLTTGKLSQMMNMNRDPSTWIYMLITERGFQCPALDPLIWLKSCAEMFPKIVSIKKVS